MLVACSDSDNDQDPDDSTFVGSRAGRAGVNNHPGVLTALPTAGEKVNGEGVRKLLMLYMVGSDLESGSDAGTTDLLEVQTALNAMSDAQLANFDIVVAFGGSEKEGWKGMRIADTDLLFDDAEDGIYGNLPAESYRYLATGANMGDQSSLELFFRYINQTYENYDDTALVMWDHGSAYGPFGNDDNFNSDALSLSEINGALAAASPGEPVNNGKLGMIGFDACLNGNLEIASVTQPYAEYHVGSEELEPGHGWNYTFVVNEFGKGTGIRQFATGLVDNYVNHGSHPYKSDGKTLSVYDQTQFAPVRSAVDALYADLSSNYNLEADIANAVIDATEGSFGFGKSSREDESISIDLREFITILKSKLDVVGYADTHAKMSAVETALDAYIIKTAQDGTRAKAGGITIAPPSVSPGSYASVKFSNGVESLVKTYAADVSSDDTAPVEALALATRNAEGDSVNEIRARFIDDNLASVHVIYGFQDTDTIDGSDEPVDYFLPIITFPADYDEQNDEYVGTTWEGKGFFLNYGEAEEDSVFIPVEFNQRYENEEGSFEVYTTEVDFVPASVTSDVEPGSDDELIETAVLQLVARVNDDDSLTVVDHHFRTYVQIFDNDVDDHSTLLFDRNDRRLAIGDRVVFYSQALAMDEGEEDEFITTSDSFVQLTQTANFSFEGVEHTDSSGQVAVPEAALAAFDIAGNFTLTAPREIVVE
ncbi:clostripain-related cysteine peptidase [Granulosicoccus antarcticus]|uniref:clostripain-related cysteine peptidase n=1 Tax=Granulosicoccus antarcticus TaxID=437505 RepID=UPI0012FD5BA8|nr:clostripain-related cysteine peptidase [Granulosicoccus antarcticus]